MTSIVTALLLDAVSVTRVYANRSVYIYTPLAVVILLSTYNESETTTKLVASSSSDGDDLDSPFVVRRRLNVHCIGWSSRSMGI